MRVQNIIIKVIKGKELINSVDHWEKLNKGHFNTSLFEKVLIAKGINPINQIETIVKPVSVMSK